MKTKYLVWTVVVLSLGTYSWYNVLAFKLSQTLEGNLMVGNTATANLINSTLKTKYTISIPALLARDIIQEQPKRFSGPDIKFERKSINEINPRLKNNPSQIQYGKYPQTSQRLLNELDLKGVSQEDLKIMLNEILARKGVIFEDHLLNEYFSNQKWYQELKNIRSHGNYESLLTDIEKENIAFIKSKERFVDSGKEKSEEIKQILQQYYKSIDENEFDVMSEFIAPQLTRWYSLNDVDRNVVMSEFRRYRKAYPNSITQLDLNSIDITATAKGFDLVYKLNYKLKSVSTDEWTPYALKIIASMNRDFKFTSKYEIRL